MQVLLLLLLLLQGTLLHCCHGGLAEHWCQASGWARALTYSGVHQQWPGSRGM
jgi:hypothetical protein